MSYETLNQVQGDEKAIATQPQREEKHFPLLPSGSETALGRRPKGDEGGLDNFFQSASVMLQ